MEVYYLQKPFALVGDIYGIEKFIDFNLTYLLFILAPVHNVATLEASAVVSEGVSRVRNALINGDYLSYDWDSGREIKVFIRNMNSILFSLGYTCHQIGSGGIVIQLCQPHVVSSMRYE